MAEGNEILARERRNITYLKAPQQLFKSYLVSTLPSGESIILSVVPESAASNRVDDDEENHEDDVDNCDLLPVPLYVGENTCLA